MAPVPPIGDRAASGRAPAGCAGGTTPLRLTRLAPSPTGSLHLGNARTFLVNWALARQRGWEILLRVEDLDTPRVKPGAIDQTIDLLGWLGLDWDTGPFTQASGSEPYAAAMRTLAARRRIYPCRLTRREIAAVSSAPNEGDGELRFPATLRPLDRPTNFDPHDTEDDANWRLEVPDADVRFTDRIAGDVTINPQATVGDFVVWTKRGTPSYQLAVVVDDHRQGVTDVVRGADLLDSAARQRVVADALGLDWDPTWWHLPLVRGPDGRRLAKRHGDTRLSAYRDAGVPPERVVGLCARWCGVGRVGEAMDAKTFAERFDIRTMPTDDAVFWAEDERWLSGG